MIMPDPSHPAPIGADLLNPHLNRAAPFPLADRRAPRIERLTRPVADTLEIQIAGFATRATLADLRVMVHSPPLRGRR
jgi:hypothetical protein